MQVFPAAGFPAAGNCINEGTAEGRIRERHDGLLTFLHMETNTPVQEFTVTAVGAEDDSLLFVRFQDGHGQRTEIAAVILLQVFHLRDHGRILQIDLADAVVILGFPRILQADHQPGILPLPQRFLADGRAEEISLHLAGTDFPEEPDLFLCFHALDNGIDSQAHSHIDQFSEDNPATVGSVKFPHKAHVQLDRVKAKVLQDVQGAESAAKVVHPYLEAILFEPLNLPFHEIKVGADNAFRDFNPQQTPVNPGKVHPAGNFLHHIAGIKVSPAQVYGNRYQGDAVLLLLPEE